MLRVKSEPMLRAKYRLLQSWYRHTVLLAPAGRYSGKYRGNHLSPEWVASHPNANFLSPKFEIQVLKLKKLKRGSVL